jgi:hypothetical protein
VAINGAIVPARAKTKSSTKKTAKPTRKGALARCERWGKSDVTREIRNTGSSGNAA